MDLRFDWLSGHAASQKYRPLSKDEELSLILAWQENGDLRARDRIILSFLPLALPLAMKAAARKGGRASRDQHLADFMHEAVLGLMRAIDRFSPRKGFRFSTYARWWILAAINEYLTRTHSLVPFITSSDHKRLFFRLGHEIRAAENHLRSAGAYTGAGDALDLVAERLSLPRDFLATFAARLSGDFSLNAPGRPEEGAEEFIDFIESEDPDAEEFLIGESGAARARQLVESALASLSERERDIIRRRRLDEDGRKQTLSAIGREYGITTERVRQIEAKALEKMERQLSRHRSAFC